MYHVQRIIVLTLAITARVCPSCDEESPSTLPKYHLVEKCHRSKLSVVLTLNASLRDCQRIGAEKKGLALNFSPPEVMSEGVRATCEILRCPEADGGLSLVNDSRYDYYSLYAKVLPGVNASCVPGVGMLLLLPGGNASAAAAACGAAGGGLAAPRGEARTDALAQLLAGAGVDEAFTGMRSENGSDFVGVDGESFECSTYRAWAPGHPRRRRRRHGCVTVTRHRTWRTLPCGARRRALCELTPAGPYPRRGTIFKSRTNGSTTTEAPITKKERKAVSKINEEFE